MLSNSVPNNFLASISWLYSLSAKCSHSDEMASAPIYVFLQTSSPSLAEKDVSDRENYLFTLRCNFRWGVMRHQSQLLNYSCYCNDDTVILMYSESALLAFFFYLSQNKMLKCGSNTDAGDCRDVFHFYFHAQLIKKKTAGEYRSEPVHLFTKPYLTIYHPAPCDNSTVKDLAVNYLQCLFTVPDVTKQKPQMSKGNAWLLRVRASNSLV